MEKSTILARLAAFSIVCFLLFPLNSCTKDDEEGELYLLDVSATTQTTNNSGKKKDDKDIDKKDVILKKKKKKKKKNTKN